MKNVSIPQKGDSSRRYFLLLFKLNYTISYLELQRLPSFKMALVLAMSPADSLSPTTEFPPFEDFPLLEEAASYEGSVANMADPASPLPNSPTSPISPTVPANRLVDKVARIPDRQPSPQPTHFSVPYRNGNGNGHRVLRSATVGYTAPEFKGKKEQMVLG